eukprot:CAMPEP_0185748804 /NCGR_PEP_ID=MMETSP1174-20130828/7512_1 /TAXON_ID=35687 /ORGANISM="Dictyocha speculum, Strain CCMP1381" /LENGTH=120 /DNA_ID=CAMNT_0028424645 /DNA_START=59 /DNA_END=421 /DNA_ORIENTATION=+
MQSMIRLLPKHPGRHFSSSVVSATKYLCLRYSYISDVLEKRPPFREAHIAKIREMETKGKVALAGAFNEPCDGAVFLFDSEKTTKAEIEAFAENDPYVTAGLVTKWDVCEYMGVVGYLQS